MIFRPGVLDGFVCGEGDANCHIRLYARTSMSARPSPSFGCFAGGPDSCALKAAVFLGGARWSAEGGGRAERVITASLDGASEVLLGAIGGRGCT